MSIGYWAKAISRIGANIALDVVRPRGRHFEFTKCLLSSGLAFDTRGKARSVDFLDLYPQAAELVLPPFSIRYSRSNVSPYELYCLCAIAILKRAANIFEFSTFDGATTLLLARACDNATVVTIDLGDADISSVSGSAIASENMFVKNGKTGERYKGEPEAPRIVQLLGDSTKYDYSVYYGTMDLVFVDACHEYEFVRADSQTALKLIGPGGTVVWHDYESGWPGVVRAVDELEVPGPMRLIASTAMAIMDTSGEPS